jgi:hypothetical protein
MRRRSPDEAKRNPGTVHHATKVPGYASLHPGYRLIEALKALHPDEMSPREALEALYALEAKLPKG